MYKKTIKLKFENQEEFQKIESILKNAGIKVEAFATFAFNRVWAEVLEEHQRQLAAQATAPADKAEGSV